MNVGIVGLGLIGGSLAKSIKKNTDHNVYGKDINVETLENALKENAIDNELDDTNVNQCEVVIVALYPEATMEYIEKKQKLFKDDAIVIDTCGIKEEICDMAFPIAHHRGFTFIGGHPMAGIEYSGFDNSFDDLFFKSSMILVPDHVRKPDLEKAEDLLSQIGFGNIILSDPKEHDKIIAYTSQLAHVVSSAYVKSPTASVHMGFSAGSFQDMTRVAKLNEDMWSQLFIDNKENLSTELERLIQNLKEYKSVIDNDDRDKLKALLAEGKRIREGLTDARIQSK